MLEHLSHPEYLHVLLNPLPVYGLAVGAFGLVIALISRSRAARVTALALVLISGVSAWPSDSLAYADCGAAVASCLL